jgi:FkbM family methyltransferase
MNLHKASVLNRVAKSAAPALAKVICSDLLYKPVRVIDAYLNFLMGRGAGTGWDLDSEIRIASKFLKSAAPVVFDVGANVGKWSERMLKAHPEVTVYMFEPSPKCREEIYKLGLSRNILIPAALGSSPGVSRLNFSSDTDGSASLHARGDSYFQDREYRSIEVEVTTIDQVLEKHSIEFVDFMKMDIEGHEFNALEGASKSLKEKRIGALSFEFGSGNINSRTFFRDFWKLLSSSGFSISRIAPGDILIPIHEYYEDLEYYRGVSNYIATLQDSEVR